MYQDHYISDKELKKYRPREIRLPLDNNIRAHLLYKEQSQNFSWLKKNLKILKNQQTKELNLECVQIRLMLNPTRKNSIKADTFKNKHTEKCVLCNLPPDQRGFPILENQYFIIPNPGITIPGDLTISATEHKTQEISGNFLNILETARELYDYSVYYNGPLAGASCPHLHFQAGREKKLPGENQIFSLLQGENIGPELIEIQTLQATRLFRISDFLRECYLIVGPDKKNISKIFKHFIQNLKAINENFKPGQNVQKFGEYIPALDKKEDEPRINIMANWVKEEERYIIAIFPKRTNRPKIFYDEDNKIMLGMGVKESLGNLIIFRQQDFKRLKKDTSQIIQAYEDTSILKRQSEELAESFTKSVL
ncbi:MAG: DUF4922 domain-containing protein [Candidatus Marinimicrobia bacterium]|nr:DUF4922 domain-containing protein [Candidatus Neomarinimicrobiota bacterium]